jgi:GH25 family lysozyme M1 (1,4-beta-N-acetylmuramidase)
MSYRKKGIDISRWQSFPDFSRVKNDVDYVILQAGYGKYATQKDSSWNYNISNCKKNNIPVGVYWYSYARSVADAHLEAKACLEVIKGYKFEYPIYYDLEENLGAMGMTLVSNIATAFCSDLEAAGYFAGIYISRSPAQSYLTDNVKQKYALWLAEYSSNLNYSGPVGMWQYSSSGKISGIDGNVDMNYCYEDYPTLIKNAGLNGYTKPPANTLDTTGFKKGDKNEINANIENYAKERRDKQPLDLPSAGCIFKNPKGNFAAKLIEEAGLGGAHEGGAMVSKKHHGFIVNTGNATAADIVTLMNRVRNEVYKNSGVRLEPELIVLGKPGRY